MKKKRLVFITGNDDGKVGIVEWQVEGNLNMDTFDPVAVFEDAMKANRRWDGSLGQPTENLIYVFYPEGNPGLIEFTEDINLVPGDKFCLSRVTKYQTISGMIATRHKEKENGSKNVR